MQLLLLSGGSGKRLWPLSNNTRSKQFLPLLENKDGHMESMLQRVIRQIVEAKLTDEITIATNDTQKSLIIRQLGEMVSIVTEPERRDTFPAIALAACFLKFKKSCKDSEVVVVMPCDPYTQTGYFDTVRKMVCCVEHNVADLVLMGIMPTSASSKFGYIVPSRDIINLKLENTNHLEQSSLLCEDYQVEYMRVARFTEKPTTEVAEELIRLNAFWNGGVFAFRLGFIINIIEKYISTDSFEVIRKHYKELPKISFDYEVVERTRSVAVVPYSGEWKDIGTWNALTEKLHCPIIGNAVMGDHCVNTHIINELQQPIYVDGLKNMVVAANSNGILVCSKFHSEDIKFVVDDLSSYPMYEKCNWGSYRLLDKSKYDDGQCSLTRSITIKKDKKIFYHMHKHSLKVLTVVNGKGIIDLDGKEQFVKEGDVISIPKGHRYAIKAIAKLTFIEVQSGNLSIMDDVERIDGI